MRICKYAEIRSLAITFDGRGGTHQKTYVGGFGPTGGIG